MCVLVVANVCFSAKAVLVKLLYRQGLDTESVIALRMLLAAPFYLFTLWWLGQRDAGPRLGWRQWAAVSGLGILSYYVSSMLDFSGLQYVSAGVERLILYTYPTMVLLISALLLGKKVTRIQLLALALTYAGIILAFVAEQGLGDQKNFMLGGLLILGCAFTYSIYVVYTGELVHRIGSARFTSLAVLAATVPALLQSMWHNGMDIFHYSPAVYGLSVWLAVAATVIPTFLIVEGIRLVGSGNAGIIGFVGPVATIALAWIFLGEAVGFVQVLGTVIVLAGVSLLMKS